jgi:hypothetical protein
MKVSIQYKEKDAKKRFSDRENQDKGKKSFAREKSKRRKDIFFMETCISGDEWCVGKSSNAHTPYRSSPAHLLPLRAFHLACLGVAERAKYPSSVAKELAWNEPLHQRIHSIALSQSLWARHVAKKSE